MPHKITSFLFKRLRFGKLLKVHPRETSFTCQNRFYFCTMIFVFKKIGYEILVPCTRLSTSPLNELEIKRFRLPSSGFYEANIRLISNKITKYTFYFPNLSRILRFMIDHEKIDTAFRMLLD